jgi:hypothetical protein
MNFKELTLASFAAALVLSTGCVVDDDPSGDTETDSGSTTNSTTPTGPTTDPGTSGPTTTDPTTGPSTDTEPGTGTDPTGDTETDTDTDDIDPDVYDFREDDPSAYTQVDRKGFPALNTALIPSEEKDAYNASNPAADVSPAGTFANEAVATLQALHGAPVPPGGTPEAGAVGLNDDLFLANTLLGTSLTPCGATVTENSCLQQAVPLAFPDVVRIDTTAPAGFPNGRSLDVPVIDVILAAVLIRAESVADLLVFADLDPTSDEVHGLSQSPNDADFSASFPYLAPAHE